MNMDDKSTTPGIEQIALTGRLRFSFERNLTQNKTVLRWAANSTVVGNDRRKCCMEAHAD